MVDKKEKIKAKTAVRKRESPAEVLTKEVDKLKDKTSGLASHVICAEPGGKITTVEKAAHLYYMSPKDVKFVDFEAQIHAHIHKVQMHIDRFLRTGRFIKGLPIVIEVDINFVSYIAQDWHNSILQPKHLEEIIAPYKKVGWNIRILSSNDTKAVFEFTE